MRKRTPDDDGRAGKAATTVKGRGLRGPLLKVLKAGVPLAGCGAPAAGMVAFGHGAASGEGCGRPAAGPSAARGRAERSDAGSPPRQEREQQQRRAGRFRVDISSGGSGAAQRIAFSFSQLTS